MEVARRLLYVCVRIRGSVRVGQNLCLCLAALPLPRLIICLLVDAGGPVELHQDHEAPSPCGKSNFRAGIS